MVDIELHDSVTVPQRGSEKGDSKKTNTCISGLKWF